MRRILIAAFGLIPGLALIAAPAPAQQDPQPEETHALIERVPVHARHFMVAAAHPLAAQAGYEVLKRGGTAADAAVAVQAMLGLVEPQSSGLGGGAFALYWDAASGRLTTYDARETAPLAATPEYWLGDDGQPRRFFDAVPGGRSVGVPGTPMLMDRLHADHGRLDWAGLIDPARRVALDGFEVSPRMAASVGWAATRGLDRFARARDYFLPGGAPLAEGAILRNPDYADSLAALQKDRSAPFYTGDIARAIVAATTSAPVNPGLLTMADFARYRVVTRDPVCAAYRGLDVCGMGPPSSGGLTVGQILSMLSRFDLAARGPSADGFHLLAEASRLSFADRGLYMADADFVAVPEGLLNAGYLADRAALIDPVHDMGKAAPGEPPWKEGALWAPDVQPERTGTSHFVIVDGDGSVLSMTTTIETGFGSRLMVGGFLLNNELTDFSFRPTRDARPIANRVQGGKRPRSSMAPTIVLRDGRPVIATGSPGGSRIIGYVAQTLVAMIDWEMDPQAAADLPHVVNRNGATDVETDAPDAWADGLSAMGHDVKRRNMNSGIHTVVIGPEGLTGGADRRREGLVLGD